MADQVSKEEFERLKADYEQLKAAVQTAGRSNPQTAAPIVNTAVSGRFVQSSTYMQTPKLTTGKSYKRYVQDVKIWQDCMIATGCKREDLAVLLMTELPTNDAHGGLKMKIWNDVGMEKLHGKDGVKELLRGLDKYMKKPSLVALKDWFLDWSNLSQKTDQSFDSFVSKLYELTKEGEDDFAVKLPDKLIAVKMLTGVRSITPEQIASITHHVKMDDDDREQNLDRPGTSQGSPGAKIHVQVENQIRQFCQSLAVAGGKSAASKSGDLRVFLSRNTDAFGKNCDSGPDTPDDIPPPDNVSRAYWSKTERENKRKANREYCNKNNLCYECHSKDHRLGDCPGYKAKLEKIKKRKLEKGEVWEDRSEKRDKQEDRPARNFLTRQVVEDNDGLVINMPNDERFESDDALYEGSQGRAFRALVVINDDLFNVLMTTEVNNHGLLDSGCQKTCSGKEWHQNFIASLDEHDKKSVKYTESDAKFKFGSGNSVKSLFTALVPVYIAGKRRLMAYDVLPLKLPLLISVNVMKRLNMSISYGQDEDTAKIDDKNIKLTFRDGHQWIALTQKGDQDNIITSSEVRYKKHDIYEHETEVLIAFSSIVDEGKEAAEFKKLHENLGHLAKDRLINLIKRTGKWQTKFEEIIDNIYRECVTTKCRERGSLIDSKSGDEMVERIMMLWFAAGLPPIKVLQSDNGGEFCNSQVTNFCKQWGIIHSTTTPYYPQGNGVCERVHALVDKNMSKITEQHPDISQEAALSWALFAHNATHSDTGYSPQQLVFGINQTLAGPVDLMVTQAEDWSEHSKVTEIMRYRLDCLKNHLEIKNSRKIRNVILRKSVPSVEPKRLGQWVFLKRQDEWVGPAQVTHSLESECAVKVGNKYYNCRHADLLPLTQNQLDRFTVIDQREHDVEPREDDEDEEPQTGSCISVYERITNTEPTLPHVSEGVPTHEPDPADVSHPAQEKHAEDNSAEQVDDEHAEDSTADRVDDVPSSNSESNDLHASTAQISTDNVVSGTADELKRGDKIDVWTQGQWRQAKIYSRDNKCSGNTFRFQYLDKRTLFSADFDQVHWRHEVSDDIPESNSSTASSTDDAKNERSNDNINHEQEVDDTEWAGRLRNRQVHKTYVTIIPYDQHGRSDVKAAKEKEIQQLHSYGTFEELDVTKVNPDDLDKAIAATWVITEKGDPGKEYIKARLCCRGDKEQAPDVRTDSPTGSKLSLRFLLSWAASEKFIVKTIDFSNAFVQGRSLDRLVLMKPPADVRRQKPGIIWKLRKCLYGLKDASRRWHLRLDEEIKKTGAKASHLDKSLYFLRDDQGVIQGFALVHVDDVLYGGTQYFEDTVIKHLKTTFTVGKVEESSFCFTGWDITQDEDGITMSQRRYQDQLDVDKFTPLAEAGDNKELLSDVNQDLFRQGLGQLQWLSHNSMPQKAFNSCQLATKVGQATRLDGKKLFRALTKAKDNKIEIMFSNLGPMKDWQIQVFTDASQGDPTKKPTFVADVTTVSGRGRTNVLDWQTRKNPIPCISSLAAESEAALNGKAKIDIVRYLLTEVSGIEFFKAELITDNRSLADAVKSSGVPTDKRSVVAVATLRKMIDEEDARLTWCESKKNIADILTKEGVDPENIQNLLKKGILPKF